MLGTSRHLGGLALIGALLCSNCATAANIHSVRGSWDIQSPSVPTVAGAPWFQWFIIDTNQLPNSAKLIWSTPLGCDVASGSFRNGTIITTNGRGIEVAVRFHDRRTATVVLQYPNGTTEEYTYRKTSVRTNVGCE